MDKSNYVTVDEAAEILNVNRKHVYRLLARGVLKRHGREVYKPHGPSLIARAEVEALASTLLPKPQP